MTPRAARDSEDVAFLATYDPAAFDPIAVTVDVVILGIVEDALRVLLVDRLEPPEKGIAALPGGFVRVDESPEAAAERVLADKAGLSGIFLEQLFTFGAPKRDPRMRVLSVAHYALVDSERFANAARRAGTSLVPVATVAKRRLAFDHAAIVAAAVRRIRGKLDYAPIGYELLPHAFTLFDLQRVHECVGGKPVNKDSFRRRMLASGLLVATGEVQDDVGHRPAALYRYARPRPAATRRAAEER
jgi:8-oxo-dGTP diphosphatase